MVGCNLTVWQIDSVCMNGAAGIASMLGIAHDIVWFVAKKVAVCMIEDEQQSY